MAEDVAGTDGVHAIHRTVAHSESIAENAVQKYGEQIMERNIKATHNLTVTNDWSTVDPDVTAITAQLVLTWFNASGEAVASKLFDVSRDERETLNEPSTLSVI